MPQIYIMAGMLLTFVTHEHAGEEGIVGEVQERENDLRAVRDEDKDDKLLWEVAYGGACIGGA
jgi:hypothetical protein